MLNNVYHIRFTKYPSIIEKEFSNRWKILNDENNKVRYMKVNNLWLIYSNKTALLNKVEWNWSGKPLFDFNFSNNALCFMNQKNDNWQIAILCKEVYYNDNEIIKCI